MQTLIVGGTGMLEAASVELALRSSSLTMVARTKRSLARYQDLCSHPHLHLIQTDWNDEELFLETIANHIARIGPPDLVVAWLHHNDLGPKLAEIVCNHSKKATFVQICGSMNPRRSTDGNLNVQKHIDYRRVILGFIETSGSRRWLTHNEICEGVISAIDGKAQEYVVGDLDD